MLGCEADGAGDLATARANVRSRRNTRAARPPARSTACPNAARSAAGDSGTAEVSSAGTTAESCTDFCIPKPRRRINDKNSQGFHVVKHPSTLYLLSPMRHTSRLPLALLAAGLLAVGAAACGSDDDASSTPPPPRPARSDTGTEATAGTTTPPPTRHGAHRHRSSHTARHRRGPGQRRPGLGRRPCASATSPT